MLECEAAPTGGDTSLKCKNSGQAVTEFVTSVDFTNFISGYQDIISGSLLDFTFGNFRRKRSLPTPFAEACIPPDAGTFEGCAYFQFEVTVPEVSKSQSNNESRQRHF